VSQVGFGASPLGGIYGSFAEQDGIDAVHAALDNGINFLDVSPYYGLTAAETVLGRALRGIGRERYVLATKVGRYGDDSFDFSATRVIRSVHESLVRLGVDYIDLIQCHDIEFGSLDQIARESIPALRELQDDGVVGLVGVTGYPLAALLYVASRTPVDTAMSYCHYTLQDRRLAALIPAFSAAGTAMINASPFAMGALTDQGPPAWHPASRDVLARCAQAAAACRDRGVSLAKLALQFAVTTSPCLTTVFGSASAAQLQRDVGWIDEPLDEDLLAMVDGVLRPVRDRGWISGRQENQNPDKGS
jgi:L-galactose dehydrogenase